MKTNEAVAGIEPASRVLQSVGGTDYAPDLATLLQLSVLQLVDERGLNESGRWMEGGSKPVPQPVICAYCGTAGHTMGKCPERKPDKPTKPGKR